MIKKADHHKIATSECFPYLGHARGKTVMDWDKLRVFLAVADAGSFTHAGDLLTLSQSAVSRQISALEEGLQVPLFHRHARGLILTEQGETLHRTVRDVFGKLAMTEAILTESRDRPTGRLKVTTTSGFGLVWVVPRVAKFLEAYPDVSMNLILDDGDLDLSMRQADVAIRLHAPKQPELIQRHLITIEWLVFASPEYLARRGTPKTLDDLEDHKLVLFGDHRVPVPEINWLAEIGRPKNKRRAAALEVNSLVGMLEVIRQGVGIGVLPHYMQSEAPDLVRILPDLDAPKIDAYFVYPEELRHSKRVEVFRDFLLEQLQGS